MDMNLVQPVIALLYVGPDQMLPVVSAVGGLLGVLLIWWAKIAAFFSRLFGGSRNPKAETPAPAPTKEQ